MAAVLATCERPRRRGRGVEYAEVAVERGRPRRGDREAPLHGGDASERGERPAVGPTSPRRPPATGLLVTVRRGKTNPAGETKDVRFVKGDVARALQTLRSASSSSPGDQVVPLSPQMVGAAIPGGG